MNARILFIVSPGITFYSMKMIKKTAKYTPIHHEITNYPFYLCKAYCHSKIPRNSKEL